MTDAKLDTWARLLWRDPTPMEVDALYQLQHVKRSPKAPEGADATLTDD